MKKILLISVYVLLFLLLFRVFLTIGFPNEALCDFLESQIGSQTGTTVKIEDARLNYLGVGINLYDVKLLRFTGDRGILLVKLDKIATSMPLIPMLTGQRVVDFKADIYNGKLKGRSRLEANQTVINAEIRELDLKSFSLVRDTLGMKFVGQLQGIMDFSIDPTSIRKSSGSIDMEIIGGYLEKSTIFGIELPKIDFSKTQDIARIKMSAKRGTLSLEEVRFKGSDLELQVRGNVRLSDTLPDSRANCNVRLTLQPQYKQQLSPVVLALLGDPEQNQFSLNLMGKISELEFEPSF